MGLPRGRRRRSRDRARRVRRARRSVRARVRGAASAARPRSSCRPIAGVYLTRVLLGPRRRARRWSGIRSTSTSRATQSFLYISDALTFSPLEVYLALTVVSWFAHVAGARDWRLLGRPLLWPVLVVRRLGRGRPGLRRLPPGRRPHGRACGSSDRSCTSSRCTCWRRTCSPAPSHYVSLAWVVVLAISIQNLFAIRYYYALSRGAARRCSRRSPSTRPRCSTPGCSCLRLAVCVFRGCSRWARFLLLLAAIPTAWVFVLSERRAAVVALAAGFVVFAIVLFFRRRKAFFVLVPDRAAAHRRATRRRSGTRPRAWASERAPSSRCSRRTRCPSATRRRTSIGRSRTTTSCTPIRAEPLTGVGFGKPFYQPVPLPDISFFVFYAVHPAQLDLWIWLKMGYLGFVALLFLIAAALRAGTRASLQLPSGDALGGHRRRARLHRDVLRLRVRRHRLGARRRVCSSRCAWRPARTWCGSREASGRDARRRALRRLRRAASTVGPPTMR